MLLFQDCPGTSQYIDLYEESTSTHWSLSAVKPEYQRNLKAAAVDCQEFTHISCTEKLKRDGCVNGGWSAFGTFRHEVNFISGSRLSTYRALRLIM